MGADYSILADCKIDDSPILSTKDWSLHHAQNQDHGPLSVFIGQDFQVDSKINTLATNLKQFRHPAILRFLSWNPGKSGTAYLFTEKASPLTVVKSQQSSHAICLGLLEVCQALVFLHIKGQVLHNNICANAIFVTPSGRWKLAGLEFATRQTTNIHINNPLYQQQTETSRDVLALGILVTELLSDSEDPSGREFLQFARDQMLLPDSTRRPTMEIVLQQPYFQQNFIYIFAFLRDLTLKSSKEKEMFFTTLGKELETCPENVIGLQYIPLLLSRYVLMDKTARNHLLPRILIPKSCHPDSLLSEKCFREYVLPQIKTMFLVHDTGIRMVLLDHFSKYSSAIDQATLEDDILPSLLLGLRDNNPEIVAATLRALADLIPILGPEKVIGTNRAKIFSDGSPALAKDSLDQLPVLSAVSAASAVSAVSATSSVGDFDTKRLKPVAAKVLEQCPSDINLESEEEEWDSWDNHEEEGEESPSSPPPPPQVTTLTKTNGLSNGDSIKLINNHQHHHSRKASIDTLVKNVQELDILKLDVKVSKLAKVKVDDEVDFFADMTPQIPKAETQLEKFQSQLNEAKKISEAKFAPIDDDLEENGWDEENLDWND